MEQIKPQASMAIVELREFLSPKPVLGSAGSKNISYDRNRKEPSGPICLHICAVLNPSS